MHVVKFALLFNFVCLLTEALQNFKRFVTLVLSGGGGSVVKKKLKYKGINPFSPSVLYKGRQLLLPFFYTESHYF